MKEKHLYSFGEFSLNVEDHTLSRNGETVPVTPKMFDLLLVLVQNPGKVLRKDFLMQSVWPDSFVEEGNITFNIRQLRKALDDNAQSPTYIETIPRRGYRFLLPVEAFTTVTPDKDEESIARQIAEAEPVLAAERKKFSATRSILTAAVVVLLLGAVGLGAWFLKSRGSSSVPILSAPFASEKLSTDGNVFHIAISPDGKNIVYTHKVSGTQSIWVRQLETSSNVPIVPASYAFYGGLAISPDGNSVYFARGEKAGDFLSIFRMPIFGGVPQKIIDETQGWISLSTDGEKISFVRCRYTDEDYCSLYIADAADGRNEKLLVTRPRPYRIGDNKISPDGRTVAFAAGQSRTSSNEFAAYGVDIETLAERELTPERFFNIPYLAWLPDQSGLLLTGMQLPDRNYSIWKVSASGEGTKLTADSETYSRLSLDAAGRILVATKVAPDFRLLLYQTDNPGMTPRVMGDANSVAFAPDGKLYFSSHRTGDSEIWSINPDGTDLRQLTNNPAADIVPMISPHSPHVFFQSDRTGVIQIWRMSPDGTNQRQVTSEDGGLPVRVSPDGAWIYYRSALNGTLRRASIETGQEELVLNATGRGLVVSPDLTRVAYSVRKGTGYDLFVASLPDGRPIKTWQVAVSPDLMHLAWSTDGKTLSYVLANEAAEINSLWYQDIDSDKPRQIADLSGDEISELSGFSLSFDGKSFAVIKGTWRHDGVLIRGLK